MTVTFNNDITLLDSTKISIVDDLNDNVKSGLIYVNGGNGSSTVLKINYSGLENDKEYRLNILPNAVRDIDGNTNNSSVYYFHTTSTTTVSAISIIGIDAQKTSAISDGTYTNGWRWLFHLTVPTNETNLNIKFDNWLNGSNSISPVNNMRFYSAQSSNAKTSNSAININSVNSYGVDALTLDSDADVSRDGRQVDLFVEMSLPVGTISGSYSTNYGIKSN